jgi:hypothetical protein
MKKRESGENPTSISEERSRRRWGAGRIAVTALWPLIEDALQAGHSLRMIYEAHQSGLDQSYSNFIKHVAQRKWQAQQAQSRASRIRSPVTPARPADIPLKDGPHRFRHIATGDDDNLI